MCIFSGSVPYVANTNIFARLSEGDSQFLAYQMTYSADQAVAMILPLPVKTPANQQSVRFINLEHYPELFTDLASAFPISRGRVSVDDGTYSLNRVLPVEQIGNFIASFVPTQKDFARLDSQFVLPPATWDRIPTYHDYGFAVFQLKPLRAGHTDHPIALEFTTRLFDCLFFPTVHIHHGHMLRREAFDHLLYYQAPPPLPDAQPSLRQWEVVSPGAAHDFVKAAHTDGLMDATLPCRRLILRGMRPNEDTFIPFT